MNLSRIFRGTNQQKAKRKLDRSTSCREAIEGLEEISIDPPSYREAIEGLEEISIDPPSCREAIKIAIRGS